MPEKKLRFRLKTLSPGEEFSKFHPGGRQVLNSTEWRGKEPRTCGITSIKSEARYANDPNPTVVTIEVSYRPPGFISFVGNTKYDGWKAAILDRAQDGTLLDGRGLPLKPGEPPVFRYIDVCDVEDFNTLDFGEFIEEVEAPGVQHVTFDDLEARWHNARSFSGSVSSTFVASHRDRPTVKIIIATHPDGAGVGAFGHQINVINKDTPHLDQLLYSRLTQIMIRFLQGEISILSFSDGEGVFVDLSDVVVDATGADSRFHILSEFLPPTFLDDLALQIMGIFTVQAEVVTGNRSGLYLRLEPPK